MALIALIAAAEAMLFSASGAKRNQVRRQQMLMGNTLDSVRALPLVDTYLKRQTAGASRVQVFVASKLAEVCRRAVQTRSFEYVLLHVIRTAVPKRRSKFLNTQGRITLNLTPSTKSSVLAGIGLWCLIWLSLFKADEIAKAGGFQRWISSERCLRWIRQHKSTSLLAGCGKMDSAT